MTTGGDWLLLQEMLDRGDPEFVDRLRAIADADALGTFAERWYTNPSAHARRLLLAYLERPLNAFRHEALVKRLFKHAEAAGDDAVMARFLVAFDRSIRRAVRTRRHYESAQCDSWEEAASLAGQWKSQGYDQVNPWDRGRVGSQSIPGHRIVVRAVHHHPRRHHHAPGHGEQPSQEGRTVPHVLASHATVSEAPGVALFPEAGEDVSRALCPGDLGSPEAL